MYYFTIPNVQVDVTRAGDYSTGYSWLIRFLTPISYIENLIVDTSTIEVRRLLLLLLPLGFILC